MYSKNCIYDYVELNIGATDYEAGSNVLRYNIPQGAYYDIKRGPVASVALVQASSSTADLKNYSIKWLNPAFNTYNNNNDGLEMGQLAFMKTNGGVHHYRMSPVSNNELMTTPKPNTIRFVIVDEDNATLKLDKGYFIFRFTYYDQDMVDMNLRNEAYRML